METLDNRDSIYEIDEIYKYKDLITIIDKNVLKQIVFDGDEKSTAFYNDFMKLVADEIDHSLNKKEFSDLKDNLIEEMKQYLDSKKG